MKFLGHLIRTCQLKYADPDEEKDYIERKLPLNMKYYKWLFCCLVILFGILTWRYFVTHLFPQAYIAIGATALAAILFLLRRFIEKYIQVISVLYITASLIFAMFNMRNLLNKVPIHDAFYIGYALSLMQRLIDFRVADFKVVCAFNVIFIVVKFVVIKISSPSLIALVTFLQLIPIFLGFQSEKADRTLYHSLYKSKLQLLKFKKFLTDSLPNEVVVFSRDFSAAPFINNAYKKSFKSDLDSIKDSLKNLTLEGQEVEKHYELFSLIDYFPNKPISLFSLIEIIIQKINLIKDIELLSFQASGDFPCQSGNASYSFDRQAQFTENLPIRKLNTAPQLSTLNDIPEEIERIPEDQKHSLFLQKRVFKVKIVPLIWNDTESIALILDDVTHERTIMELKVADKNKNLIIAMVSHELRTPLNGILGILEIIKNMLKQAEIMPYLDACKSSGLMLLNLVNSILDLSQIKNNKLKLVYTPVCILELLNEVKSLFDYFCSVKNIYLHLEIHPDMPSEILTDETRLKQVLINLVGNAFKFTFKGGVTIKVDRVSDDDSFQKIQFTIQDTGIGIEKNDQDKLFKLFGRLDHQDSKINTNGVGLGLTISNSIVKQLNLSSTGENKGILVSSEPGKGTSFSFILWCQNALSKKTNLAEEDCSIIEDEIKFPPPLDSTTQLSIKNHSSKNTFIPVPKFKENHNKLPLCLIVDDNPFNLMVATNIMKEQGYKAITALNGQDAIQKAKENQFSLILMDCQMPVMDGYEGTRQLKKLMKNGEVLPCPIIALTANNRDEEHEEICREAGMDDVLGKPLNKIELNNSIQKLLERKNS